MWGVGMYTGKWDVIYLTCGIILVYVLTAKIKMHRRVKI